MTDTPWIKVSVVPKVLKEEHSARGVLVSYHVAPHDVPKAVRGGYDKSTDHFVIELRYLDCESFKSQKLDEYVTLRLGENSKRLLGIELNIKKFGVSRVGFMIDSESLKERAIEKLDNAVREFEKHNSPGGVQYGTAFQVVKNEQDKLMTESALVGA
ncbi:MAG: hypothetical protein P4K83_07035 [Terracidiphilus sp.]|nr:hypothetical protein [Terracidiphilus sp.]